MMPLGFFYNDMQTKTLLLTISRPTRIASSSCTLIDNIFVNNLNIFKSGTCTIDKTDLFPFFKKYDNYFETDKYLQSKFNIELRMKLR